MRFRKPPLIELIADFRWNPANRFIALSQRPPSVPIEYADLNRNEPFFSDFAGLIAANGYVQTQRLIPFNWPYPDHVAVCRFSKPGVVERAPTLFQIGSGVFSAHALPPYKSWEEFRPVIELGLESLLKSRHETERNSPFTSITLRYIDRFTQTLIGRHSTRQFIETVLGLRVQIPEFLGAEVKDQNSIEPTLLLRLPLKTGLQMNLGINPPSQAPEPGIIMDIAVTTQTETKCNREAVISVLEAAHSAIRRVFIGLTEPINQMMEPE